MQRILHVELHDKTTADTIVRDLKRIPGVISVMKYMAGRRNLWIAFWHGTDIDSIAEAVKTHDERAWVYGTQPDD